METAIVQTALRSGLTVHEALAGAINIKGLGHATLTPSGQWRHGDKLLASDVRFPPLSMPSMASMKCLYTARYTVSTSGDSGGWPSCAATMSRPKCLYTRPALDNLVLKPALPGEVRSAPSVSVAARCWGAQQHAAGARGWQTDNSLTVAKHLLKAALVVVEPLRLCKSFRWVRLRQAAQLWVRVPTKWARCCCGTGGPVCEVCNTEPGS